MATATSASGLPDGRAYELVSPPNKGGYEVSNPAFAGDARAQASITGDAVTFGAAGVFPGTGAQSSSQFVTYLATRPAGGQDQWRTKALTGPLTNPTTGGLAGFGGISDLSADLSLALTPLDGVLPGDPPAPPERNPLYLRDNVGDGFELLTPGLVPLGPGQRSESRTLYQATDDFDHLVWQDARRSVAADTLPFTGARVLESFLNDQGERELRLASILPDGSPTLAGLGPPSGVGAGSTQNSVSADGDRIFFTRSPNELYVREDGTTTTFVGNGLFSGASRDGSKVFAIDAAGALIRYDLSAGTSTVVGTGVRVGNLTGGVLGSSDDGSRFYFSSTDQLVPEAPATGIKLYLWQDAPGGATTTFIAPQSDTDSGNWDNRFNTRTSRVTPDGEHLLFVSSAQVTAFDNRGTAQVYLYRLGAGVECVSCPSGPPTAGASLTVPTFGTFDEQLGNLTDDGRRVFFQSMEALVPADGNGRLDVYQYDVATKQVALISSGRSGSDSTFADASPEGDDVFFATREALVGWDRDGVYDVYDARVGGGLPEPPEPPAACSGDECQGQPSGRPALMGPTTSTLQGLGALALAPRPAFRLARLSRAQRSRLARTGRLALSVRVNRAGRVSLTARAKMGGRSPLVARSSRRASRAGAVKLMLKLSSAARRRLARTGSLKMSLSVRFAGVREAKRLALNLRQPGPRSSSRRAAAHVDRKAR